MAMTSSTLKGKRTTVEATEDIRQIYETLKNKGFNFTTITYHAILEAVKAKMPVPQKETPTKGFKPYIGASVGVFVPTEVSNKLDTLTKPTGAKAEYIREAIRRYVADKNLI